MSRSVPLLVLLAVAAAGCTAQRSGDPAGPAPSDTTAVPDPSAVGPFEDADDYGRQRAEPAGKPSRFSSRMVLEEDAGVPGQPPRTLQALGDQSVDVSGSYRVLKNLDVTAGVRLSHDRDRLAPLTDANEDEKAVYVGTQFKF